MHIAFLNIYGGRVNRGAETAVAEIAKRLSRVHSVTVYQSGKKKEEGYPVVTISTIPVVSTDVSQSVILKLLKKLYLDPYSLMVLFFSLRLLPQLLASPYDILIPINGFWQIIICKLVQVFKGGKIVVMGYAGIGGDDYVNLKLSPDAFFAMTTTASLWAKKVASQHVHIGVIPGGVDTSVFRPTVYPRQLPLKRPIILTVAALVPYKRVDLTIAAVSRLKEVSLVVAGNGPLREKIESQGKSLLGERFLRIDVNHEALPQLYTAADVFTLPSQAQRSSLFSSLTKQSSFEAFGIVYVEAMASGLPVVGPDDDLRREIIGDAGILVDCARIDDYAKALGDALSRKWNDIPRKQAMKFDWDHVTQLFDKELAAFSSD